MKIHLQSESADCSIACIAMVLSAHGMDIDPFELRRRFPVSKRGISFDKIIDQAATLQLSARALRLEISELNKLSLPSILHWDLNHVVVLKSVARNRITIVDPAVGERSISKSDISAHFSGVALELTPTSEFQRGSSSTDRLTIKTILGRSMSLRGPITKIFATAFALEIFSLIAPIFNQSVIDDSISSGDHDLLSILVVGFGFLLIMQTMIGSWRAWMVMVLSQDLALHWNSRLFSHLLSLPPAFFENRHLGDVVSRFGSLQAIQKVLTVSSVEAGIDGVMAFAALIMMAIYAPLLSLVTITSLGIHSAVRLYFYSPFRNATAERLILSAREQTHFLESLRAIVPLKLFGRENLRCAQWRNLFIDVQNRDTKTLHLGIFVNSSSSLIFGFENLIVFWLGADKIISTATNVQATSTGLFTIGMLFTYLIYKNQFIGRISALINFFVDLRLLRLHMQRLADIALSSSEETTTHVASEAEHKTEKLNNVLELKNISFRYGIGEPWIFKNVNLKIEPGESIAIIGASGAGKTTLLKIMLGLLAPTEGEVLYDGVPISSVGLTNFRKLVGTVMQEDALLTGSLADNISFFDSIIDEQRIETAAMIANLHQEIVRMPMGYRTLVGDLGTGLSGGQKQRLLLARALYKRPKILALDEATSHLDIDCEGAINRALHGLRLTRLIIAHRPETIASAQRVAHLRNGTLV